VSDTIPGPVRNATPPAITDLDGVVDVDGHLRAALAAWEALTPQQRRLYNKEAWLAAQQRQTRHTREQQLAYDARMDAVKRRTTAENEAETAKIRARQCGVCFLVKTPAGTCNCTDD
jgi:hypothetical protein